MSAITFDVICGRSRLLFLFISFFFNDTPTTEIYTLSLHDALPICPPAVSACSAGRPVVRLGGDARSSDSRSAASKRRCRSEEHTSELQSHSDLVCRLLLEKKKKKDK